MKRKICFSTLTQKINTSVMKKVGFIKFWMFADISLRADLLPTSGQEHQDH